MIKLMKLPISFGATKSATALVDGNDFFKTLNSVYFDSIDSDTTNVNLVEDGEEDEDEMESIIRGAHSESRLFFEPSTAKSINRTEDRHLECVAMALDSEDPYEDFKRSMEEMSAVIVKNRDWSCLEELLAWYLSVNQRNNHAYIIAAFVDLLLKISNDDTNTNPNEGFSTSSRRSSSSCVDASCFSSSSASNSS